MYVNLQALRAKVRGFLAEGRSIGALIKKSRGQRRHLLWLKKRQLGSIARDHLIAYCLLRDVPYTQIENRCAQSNRPSPDRVYGIIAAHAGWRPEANRWTLDLVKALLAAPTLAQENGKSP